MKLLLQWVVKAKETLTTWSWTHRLFTAQTSNWFTVWANGKQNFRLVNFVAEARLPFVQISSLYQKMTVKAWNWYQDVISQMEHKFLFGTFQLEKTELPFQMFSLLH